MGHPVATYVFFLAFSYILSFCKWGVLEDSSLFGLSSSCLLLLSRLFVPSVFLSIRCFRRQFPLYGSSSSCLRLLSRHFVPSVFLSVRCFRRQLSLCIISRMLYIDVLFLYNRRYVIVAIYIYIVVPLSLSLSLCPQHDIWSHKISTLKEAIRSSFVDGTF
jgi:hypothetical protein